MNISSNIISILELPGLSALVKNYTKTSINVNNFYFTESEFKKLYHRYHSIHIFCYGDIELHNPARMFRHSKLKTFTSKGTITLKGDSSNMFSGATSFNSDLSKWDVGNVNIMYNMFFEATSFNSDLSKWDVKKCEDMNSMFYKSEVFDSDLSRWNVENVKDMGGMFRDAQSFNSDLSRWNVGNVTDMSNMFTGAISLNSDLSRWNVKKVTIAELMFFYTIVFDKKLVPKFKTGLSYL